MNFLIIAFVSVTMIVTLSAIFAVISVVLSASYKKPAPKKLVSTAQVFFIDKSQFYVECPYCKQKDSRWRFTYNMGNYRFHAYECNYCHGEFTKAGTMI
jgi:transposase-like protein